jgi:hypothetical protein
MRGAGAGRGARLSERNAPAPHRPLLQGRICISRANVWRRKTRRDRSPAKTPGIQLLGSRGRISPAVGRRILPTRRVANKLILSTRRGGSRMQARRPPRPKWVPKWNAPRRRRHESLPGGWRASAGCPGSIHSRRAATGRVAETVRAPERAGFPAERGRADRGPRGGDMAGWPARAGPYRNSARVKTSSASASDGGRRMSAANSCARG